MNTKKVEKGTKAGFCGSLEWKLKLQWLDLTGFHTFKDGRVARIELETRRSGDTYEGFLVTILNPKEGVVDRKFFAFADYLSERSDNRTDMPDQKFVVISYVAWDWHVAVPTTTRPLCEAVEAYIKLFS